MPMTFDFPPKLQKNAIAVSLIPGKLSRFVEARGGEELRVGQGADGAPVRLFLAAIEDLH